MKHLAVRPIGWHLLFISLVAASVFSCAARPTPQEAKDLKSLTGKWEGWGTNQKYGRFFITLRIIEEGTWEMSMNVSYFGGTHFSGKASVFEGKLEFYSEVPQLRGSYTLHSGEAERWLVFKSDDGSTTAELKPSFR